jgi:hypothetical protein
MVQDEVPLGWNSALTMLGAYKSTKQGHEEADGQEAATSQLEFLHDVQGIPLEQIRIVLHQRHTRIPGLIPKISNLSAVEDGENPFAQSFTQSQELRTPNGVNLVIVTNPDQENGFEWDYGMEGIKGIGTDWYVFNEAVGTWVSWGNVIALHNQDHQIVGFDYGGGLETLLQARAGLKHKILASRIAETYPFEPNAANFPLQVKMADAINCSVVLLRELKGFPHSASRLAPTLKGYLDGLSHLRRRLGFSNEEVAVLASDFELNEYGNLVEAAPLIGAYLQDRDRFLQSFSCVRPDCVSALVASIGATIKQRLLADPTFVIDSAFINQLLFQLPRKGPNQLNDLRSFSTAELAELLPPDLLSRVEAWRGLNKGQLRRVNLV